MFIMELTKCCAVIGRSTEGRLANRRLDGDLQGRTVIGYRGRQERVRQARATATVAGHGTSWCFCLDANRSSDRRRRVGGEDSSWFCFGSRLRQRRLWRAWWWLNEARSWSMMGRQQRRGVKVGTGREGRGEGDRKFSGELPGRERVRDYFPHLFIWFSTNYWDANYWDANWLEDYCWNWEGPELLNWGIRWKFRIIDWELLIIFWLVVVNVEGGVNDNVGST